MFWVDCLDFGKAFGFRFVLLIPMAYCIFLLLASQDQFVRLLSIVVLVILEQTREWLLIKSISEQGKDNKTGGK